MNIASTPQYPDTMASLWKLQKMILDTLDFSQVVQKITDSILTELNTKDPSYKIVYLTLADLKDQVLKPASFSHLPSSTANAYFPNLKLPFSAFDNLCIRTYQDRQVRVVPDWSSLFFPLLTPADSQQLQQNYAVKNSLLLPILEKNICIGVINFGIAKDASEISDQEKELLQSYTEVVGLAIHDAKIYSKTEKQLDSMRNEFATTTSAQLRSPLTTIKNYAWLLQHDKAGPISETAHKYLDIIINSDEQLIHMVNNLMDINFLESGKIEPHPEPVDIQKLTTILINKFAPLAEKKQLHWDIQLPKNLPTLVADRNMLTKILDNLLDNAFKFTSQGQITLTIQKLENELQFSVTDTGPGMSQTDIDSLFTRFSPNSDSLATYSPSNIGLGLYLCKLYLDLQHGQITVTSTPGLGSTFTFSLPLSNNQ